MQLLRSLAQNVKSLSVDELMTVLGNDTSFLEYVVYLNTEKQLYEQGIDAQGRYLDDIGGGYSDVTIFGDASRGIAGKLFKNQPIDRVTLKDTGEFYDSFRAFVDGSKDITISANAIKDSTDLVVEWGGSIIGLNQDSLVLLKEKALNILIPYIKEKLLTR